MDDSFLFIIIYLKTFYILFHSLMLWWLKLTNMFVISCNTFIEHMTY